MWWSCRALLLAAAAAETLQQVSLGTHGSQESQDSRLHRAASLRCEDLRDDCNEVVGPLLENCGQDPSDVLMKCMKSCGACDYATLVEEAMQCADTNAECASWAASGECQTNPRYMLSHCTTSCGTCESKREGCKRLNSTAPMAIPGGMHAMFERALTAFPEYQPTALSRPSPGTDDAPWVLQFENLLTEDQAMAMIAACPPKGWSASLAGDQLSPVRTSTQCWCDEGGGCMRAEAVHDLTMRMLNVTMLPYENAEYFQVLKYEVGQFYRQHHDQQSAHWTPQGVRLFTFFVYLSDVEEGGGTRFTDLGITVKPKLGRGILWPSVQDGNLRDSDRRTHHEALPVVKGVKYAANLWQHCEPKLDHSSKAHVLPLYHSSKASGHLATCARSIRLQDSLAKWPMCLPGQELQPCMRCVGKRDSPNQSSLGTGRDTVLDTVLDAPLIERGPRDGWAVRVLVRTVDVASLRGSEEQEVGRPQRSPGLTEAGGPTRRCRPVGVRGSVYHCDMYHFQIIGRMGASNVEHKFF